LVKAQFEVFTRQVPLMYSTLLINAWILVLVFWDHAPLSLTLYAPLVFTLAAGVRLLGWWRSRHSCPTAQWAYASLVRTNRIALVLSLFLVTWALMLYPHGDQTIQGNIVFFLAITGICVVICVMHLRSAAFIVWTVLSVAFFGHFITSGVPSFVAMAINMPFVSAALLSMVYVQSKHFTNSVNSQQRLETMSRENHRLANIDSLTGLSNRRQFFADLDEAVADSEFRQQRIAVGIIDLDGFKPVNDQYGHAMGDQLLVQVGRRLTALISDDVKVAHLGGDEFALLVEADQQDSDLLALGEAMCASISERFVIGDTSMQISATIGFAVYPDLASCTRTLYERADYALCHCKQTERGQAALFSYEQIAEIEDTQKVEGLLRTADLEAELTVYYQPIVDVTHGNTVTFEALARWHSPTLGLVPPSIFIPISERTGLIGELTHILLRKAIDAALCWPDHIGLSFNLSNHDISSPNGVGHIISIIRDSGIDPRRIDLEITETAVMGDLDQASAAINQLKALGCGIALDDFGTGFSSLTQLHSLPLTKIKIDRSFVSSIEENPASYKIVKSLLALSRDMELSCVIEGVETEAELATVSQLGGRLIQGYYYSQPLQESDVVQFLGEMPEQNVPMAASA